MNNDNEEKLARNALMQVKKRIGIFNKHVERYESVAVLLEDYLRNPSQYKDENILMKASLILNKCSLQLLEEIDSEMKNHE